jgi:hypothetical protein
MKSRVPSLLCRLGFAVALSVAAFLLPARPAAACLDDAACNNWCGYACAEFVFVCGFDCYYECLNECYCGCAPDPCSC